jgi:hypothetical protein
MSPVAGTGIERTLKRRNSGDVDRRSKRIKANEPRGKRAIRDNENEDEESDDGDVDGLVRVTVVSRVKRIKHFQIPRTSSNPASSFISRADDMGRSGLDTTTSDISSANSAFATTITFQPLDGGTRIIDPILGSASAGDETTPSNSTNILVSLEASPHMPYQVFMNRISTPRKPSAPGNPRLNDTWPSLYYTGLPDVPQDSEMGLEYKSAIYI